MAPEPDERFTIRASGHSEGVDPGAAALASAMTYKDVAEAFVEDMTAFLGGLDAGIAKAQEFAEACRDAAEGVAGIALAADEMAGAVDAAISEARGAGPLDQ